MIEKTAQRADLMPWWAYLHPRQTLGGAGMAGLPLTAALARQRAGDADRPAVHRSAAHRLHEPPCSHQCADVEPQPPLGYPIALGQDAGADVEPDRAQTKPRLMRELRNHLIRRQVRKKSQFTTPRAPYLRPKTKKTPPPQGKAAQMTRLQIWYAANQTRPKPQKARGSRGAGQDWACSAPAHP